MREMTEHKDQIRHHLPDDLLTAYSAGALPEAFALVVASHLSLCDRCRAAAESMDGLGGALLEGEAGAEMAPDALERAMALIAGALPEAAPERPEPDPDPDAILPAPLRAYVGGDVDAIRWRNVAMGVKQAVLPTSTGATARLLYIPAGAAMPDHGHRGTELTLVLQGAFEDETDRFARGDVEVAGTDDEHMPIADVGADCICLAATDAKLRFRGLLPRLAQPFLGI